MPVVRGCPFSFGPADARNVVQLGSEDVRVDLGGAKATYVLFVHAVADVATDYLEGFAEGAPV